MSPGLSHPDTVGDGLYISVFVPELEAGINGVLSHSRGGYDAGLVEHFEAWRCRRWANSVMSSLEWVAEE